MIDKSLKIFLTYQLRGKYQKQSGKYKAAEVRQIGEKTAVLNNFEVVEKPNYSASKENVTLGHYFIEEALKCPEKPRNMGWEQFFRTSNGKLHQNWNKLTEKEKISEAVRKYVSDLGGVEFSFELV